PVKSYFCDLAMIRVTVRFASSGLPRRFR
ncbi:hypothetical protein pipiens_019892, partial [Culex pipiens pipiens]